MTRRNPLRTEYIDPITREPKAPWETIKTIAKKTRNRKWEKENPSCSYKIPLPLHDEARKVRENVMSIADTIDATANSVASALIDYALAEVKKNPQRLVIVPNLHPRSRGHMTVMWESWNAILPPSEPINLQPKKREKEKTTQLVLSYRWEISDIDERIKILAETETCTKYSPFKHIIPPGEILVRLLQIGIEDYLKQKIRLKVVTKGVKIRDSLWKVRESEK